MMEAVNGMISISEELFPGLMGDGKDGTGLYEYNHGSNTFNQKLSPACVLTEFGTDLNTVNNINNVRSREYGKKGIRKFYR